MRLTSVLSLLLFAGCLSIAVSKRRDDEATSTVRGWAGLSVSYGLFAVSTWVSAHEAALSVLFLCSVIVSVVFLSLDIE